MKVRALLKLIAPLLCVLAFVGAIVCQTSSELYSPRQEIPSSFFGMHIHHVVSPNGTDPLTPWPSVKVPEWRLWDARVTWPDLEPSRGQWRFDNLDRSLAMAEAHNTEVLMTLGLTPPWASARPGEPSAYQPGFAAEPRDMEDWRVFVRTVATRYKGRIHAYEIWNEPNLKQFWSGTADQLLALTREAHGIIKSVDPTAIIVSPSATSTYGTPWLSEFLSKGGGQFVDVIGYHFYVTPKPPEEMLPLVQTVKQIMAMQNVGEKPLWDTESGWLLTAHIGTEELGAAYLARSYILLWASGVQRFYWYAWDNHKWVRIETTQADNKTLRPAGQAYRSIQKWTVGASMDRCDESSDHTWTCHLHRGNESQWIVWTVGNDGDKEKTFAVPSSWHAQSVTPLLGEPRALKGSSIQITQVPVLFSTGGASVAE